MDARNKLGAPILFPTKITVRISALPITIKSSAIVIIKITYLSVNSESQISIECFFTY